MTCLYESLMTDVSLLKKLLGGILYADIHYEASKCWKHSYIYDFFNGCVS